MSKVTAIMAATEGQWRSVAKELASETRSSLGIELFGSALESVLEETVDAAAVDAAEKFLS